MSLGFFYSIVFSDISSGIATEFSSQISQKSSFWDPSRTYWIILGISFRVLLAISSGIAPGGTSESSQAVLWIYLDISSGIPSEDVSQIHQKVLFENISR